MSFRLVPKSVTLNDLERRNGRYFALFQRIRVAFPGALCKSSRSLSHLMMSSCLLIMVVLRSRCNIIFQPCGFFFFLSSFFLVIAESQPSHIGCLLYFHTWCGLSGNLECMSEMCYTWLAENTGRKKTPFWHHRTTLSGCIFAAKACIDNRKKISLNVDTSSTCFRNMVNFGLLTAEICWRVWAPLQISTGFASSQRYCTALQQWASAKLCGVEQRAPPILGRAAITQGIGQHSRFQMFLYAITMN